MNVGLFGLGGNHSDMIIGRFRLKLFEGIIVIPPPVVGGGGIATQPQTLPYDLDDHDDYPPERRIEVNVRVRFGTMWHERVFWMLPKDAKVVVTVSDMVDVVRKRFGVVITSIRNAVQRVSFDVSKIKNKHHNE